MSTVHKTRPRTKHIYIKYHHFRELVKDGSIKLVKIDTKQQQADILTKPLEANAFEYIQKLNRMGDEGNAT
jgi:hypothetical protein